MQLENYAGLNIGNVIAQLCIESKKRSHEIRGPNECTKNRNYGVLPAAHFILVSYFMKAQSRRKSTVSIQSRDAPSAMPGCSNRQNDGMGLVIGIISSA
jgi:hypothetical protein